MLTREPAKPATLVIEYIFYLSINNYKRKGDIPMVKNQNKILVISFFLALLLKSITYAIGDFSFAKKSLFSLYSLYDFIILLIYYSAIQYVINKIIAKKAQDKKKVRI